MLDHARAATAPTRQCRHDRHQGDKPFALARSPHAYFGASSIGTILSGVVKGSMRRESLEMSAILRSGACSRSPVAFLRTAYCQTLIDPLPTSNLATPPASILSSWASSPSLSPMTISSLVVTTLNSDTVSAAKVVCTN